MDLYDVIVLGLPINRQLVDRVAARFSLTGLGEQLPAPLAEALDLDEARQLVREVERLGARATIRPSLTLPRETGALPVVPSPETAGRTQVPSGAPATVGSANPASQAGRAHRSSSGSHPALQQEVLPPPAFAPASEATFGELADRDDEAVDDAMPDDLFGPEIGSEGFVSGANPVASRAAPGIRRPGGEPAAAAARREAATRPTLRQDELELQGEERPRARVEAPTAHDLDAGLRAAQPAKEDSDWLMEPEPDEIDPFFDIGGPTDGPHSSSEAGQKNPPSGPSVARRAPTFSGGILGDSDAGRPGRELEIELNDGPGNAPAPRLGRKEGAPPRAPTAERYVPPRAGPEQAATVGVPLRQTGTAPASGTAASRRAPLRTDDLVGVAQPNRSRPARVPTDRGPERRPADANGFWENIGEAFVLPLRDSALGWYLTLFGVSFVLLLVGLFASLVPLIGVFVLLIVFGVILSLNAHFLAANYHAAGMGVRGPQRMPPLFFESRGDLVLPGILIALLIGAFVAIPVFLYGQSMRVSGSLPGYGALLTMLPLVFYFPMALTTMAHSGNPLGVWYLPQGLRAIAREPLRYSAVVGLYSLASILPSLLGTILGAAVGAIGLGWLGAVIGGVLGSMGLTYSLGVAGALMGFLVRERPDLFED